jgi:hypothetical protein
MTFQVVTFAVNKQIYLYLRTGADRPRLATHIRAGGADGPGTAGVWFAQRPAAAAPGGDPLGGARTTVHSGVPLRTSEPQMSAR